MQSPKTNWDFPLKLNDEEEKTDQNLMEPLLISQSNQMQGEAFKVMQRALDNGLEEKNLFPLIAGFAVIFVFCLMIGFLILQPDSKG